MRIDEVDAPRYNTHNLADVQHCPYYFAYGMNTDSSNMEVKSGDHVVVGTGELPDHQLEFKHHCDVVPASGINVVGVLWKVTQRGLTKLDIREGYPKYYDRQVMWIKNHEGQAVKAWVYVMSSTNSQDHNLEPPDEQYWNTVVAGYREHGLSTHQLEVALDKAWTAYEKNHNSADPHSENK